MLDGYHASDFLIYQELSELEKMIYDDVVSEIEKQCTELALLVKNNFYIEVSDELYRYLMVSHSDLGRRYAVIRGTQELKSFEFSIKEYKRGV